MVPPFLETIINGRTPRTMITMLPQRPKHTMVQQNPTQKRPAHNEKRHAVAVRHAARKKAIDERQLKKRTQPPPKPQRPCYGTFGLGSYEGLSKKEKRQKQARLRQQRRRLNLQAKLKKGDATAVATMRNIRQNDKRLKKAKRAKLAAAVAGGDPNAIAKQKKLRAEHAAQEWLRTKTLEQAKKALRTTVRRRPTSNHKSAPGAEAAKAGGAPTSSTVAAAPVRAEDLFSPTDSYYFPLSWRRYNSTLASSTPLRGCIHWGDAVCDGCRPAVRLWLKTPAGAGHSMCFSCSKMDCQVFHGCPCEPGFASTTTHWSQCPRCVSGVLYSMKRRAARGGATENLPAGSVGPCCERRFRSVNFCTTLAHAPDCSVGENRDQRERRERDEAAGARYRARFIGECHGN